VRWVHEQREIHMISAPPIASSAAIVSSISDRPARHTVVTRKLRSGALSFKRVISNWTSRVSSLHCKGYPVNSAFHARSCGKTPLVARNGLSSRCGLQMDSGAVLPVTANNTNAEMVMAPQSRFRMLPSNEERTRKMDRGRPSLSLCRRTAQATPARHQRFEVGTLGLLFVVRSKPQGGNLCDNGSVYPNHCYQQQQTGNNDYCWDQIEPMNAKTEHSPNSL